MFCCSIGKKRQIQQPKVTGQEGRDRACARTRTRAAASREVGTSGAAPGAAAVGDEQPQEESSLLPLNSTLMGVLESTTRRDETEMADQPAAKKKKSAAGSVIFKDGRRISDIVPQSPVRPPDSPRGGKFKKSLATFRGENRPDWLDCIHLFYGIRNNVTRKDVERKLKYCNYVLEPADIDAVYNKVRSAFNNHMKEKNFDQSK